MVGFVIGLLVGAMLGFTLMGFIKVGSDDLEQYYVDLIQTYDKEVNRQYKCINKAIEHIDKELGNINVQENIMAKNELLKIKSIIQGDDKE